MEKYFNGISMFVGLAGGAIAGLLGGVDAIMHALDSFNLEKRRDGI